MHLTRIFGNHGAVGSSAAQAHGRECLVRRISEGMQGPIAE